MGKFPKSFLAQGQKQSMKHAASCLSLLAQPFSLISVPCPDTPRPCCLASFLSCLFCLSFDGYHYLHCSVQRGIHALKSSNTESPHFTPSSLLDLYQKEPNTRFKKTARGVCIPIFIASKGKQLCSWPCLQMAESCHQTTEPDTRSVEEAPVSVEEKQPPPRPDYKHPGFIL